MCNRKRILILCLTALLLIFSQIVSAESFTVKAIRVRGLQRISLGTVLNYLPIKVGDLLSDQYSAKILRSLYQTGFFEVVSLDRDDSTLVINVIERATIGDIKTSGNKMIPKKKFDELLKQIGLVKGEVFNRSVLERIEKQLKEEYNNLGKYNARVTAEVKPLARERVSVVITISEGKNTRIRQIDIIGAKTFSESTLLKEFKLSTTGIISFFRGTDQYSKEKMEASLEALKSYYMDRGFIKFNIVSTQVSLTPDRKHVYITVKIEEGPRYHFNGFEIQGKTILPKDKLQALVAIKSGDVFSRKVVTDAVTAMGDALGDKGYGFPSIQAKPQIDEIHKTIYITFLITPGHMFYVRRIIFSGNIKTGDYVLRHVIKQQEGALLRVTRVKESERQLRILSFLKDISVKTVPVPGTNDQVDLIFSVTETSSAVLSASAGYSIEQHRFSVNASVTQPNFLGTGSSLGFNFNSSGWGQTYSINYYNPFYKPNGIGRGFNIYYRTTTPSKLELADYDTKQLGGGVNYNILMSDTFSFQFGANYEGLELDVNRGTPPLLRVLTAQFANFITRYGDDFKQVLLTGGWQSNSYDQFPFPTHGLHEQLDATLALPGDSSSLYFYKLNFISHWYHPLFAGFIMSAQAAFGYGNGFASTNTLPFYENFFAGGIGTGGQVRGWRSYTLGPKDSFGNSLGGNVLAAGTVDLILPHPLSQESFRTSVFFDAGNTWTYNIPTGLAGTNAGPLRYSVGVGVTWHSPLGMLMVSFAEPLNKRAGDKEQNIQFTMSSGF